MEYFSHLELPGGPFTLVETYVYYDGPKTFALKSTGLPFYYIVNAVDEDENDGSVTALAVAVDEMRFHAIRSGLVAFRDAFTEAKSGSLYTVTWGATDETPPVAWSRSEPTEVPPVPWLPAAHARLSLPTATAEAFQDSTLTLLAEAQQRSIFALEVEAPGTNVTAFPARNAGNLEVALHGAFEALGREVASGSDALKDIYPAVLGVRAASFVLVLSVETRAGMIEPVEVSGSILDSLTALLSAVGSGDPARFIEAMRQHGWRTRNRFRDMLEAVAPVGSGLALASVKAYGREVSRASATAGEVLAAIEALDSVEPTVEWIPVQRGILTGLVLRLRNFELVDAATQIRYKGKMTERAASEANNLPVGDHSFVSATIRAETAFSTTTDENSGTTYWLEEISRRRGPATPDA